VASCLLGRISAETGDDDQAALYSDLGGRAQHKMTRYPMSIWRITASILSSPISLDHIPHRYPG
jgi:hypothetical protein